MLCYLNETMPESIYNPITAMGILAMFTFQLERGKHCRHPIAVMGVVDTFGLSGFALVEILQVGDPPYVKNRR